MLIASLLRLCRLMCAMHALLQAAVSHATTPAVLLLCSTPLAMLGASLPLWATGLMPPFQLVLATAMLTGLGNSTGCVPTLQCALQSLSLFLLTCRTLALHASPHAPKQEQCAPALFNWTSSQPLAHAPASVRSYANAVSLLERYVPVTGFVNGIFGMVAGGACMVGPTTVAMLAKHTSLRWVFPVLWGLKPAW